MSFSLNSRRQLCRCRRWAPARGWCRFSAGCNDFEKRWSWPRALPLYLTTLTLTPRGSLSAPLKAPVHRMPEGIAESPTTIAPIKTGLAFFVSGLLQRIESLDIVDYTSDALRELPHGFKG